MLVTFLGNQFNVALLQREIDFDLRPLALVFRARSDGQETLLELPLEENLSRGDAVFGRN